VDFSRFEHLRPATEVETEILGGPRQGRIILAMVARFDETKDYGILISAAIKLCTKRKDLVFLLVGSGSPLEELKARVPAALERQIIFTGRRNDVESVLQIVDICLLITYYEGLSNSIIEYMAMGKPVIATDGGGTAELVKDDFNGFLVGRENEGQIMEKTELLLNNPELRRTLGQNGYRWVRQQFDVKEKTDEYIHLYKKLIREREKSA
jgi:glycosyltransferase involved in cell wall biosynthesis